MNALHVVILAAGQGTRMRSALPKVLHQLAGRPLLQHVVDTAVKLNSSAIHVVYGHGGEKVKLALQGQGLSFVEQKEQLGTGHAVEQAMPNIPDDAVVLVLYGDVPLVVPETLAMAVSTAADGGVGLLTMHLDDAHGYGRILRASGNVTGIVEEKDASEHQRTIREANTGILAAPSGQMRAWLSRLDRNNSQGELYLTDVIAMAAADGVEIETPHPGALEEVLGVNDRVQLSSLERWYQRREAERLMRAGATLADPARLDVRGHVEVGQDVFIDVNVVLEGSVQLGDGVTIGPNTTVKNSSIAAGATIFANCVIDEAKVGAHCLVGPFARLRPGADLGESARVGNFVEVKNTRLGVGSKANHLTYLGDADIGIDVNVGAGTITCNYDGANKHRTVIGDRAFIGSGVELVAPITIHPDATVGAGSTLGSDAPAGDLTVVRARARTIKGWKRPVKQPKKV